jgi:hypothetical protein
VREAEQCSCQREAFIGGCENSFIKAAANFKGPAGTILRRNRNQSFREEHPFLPPATANLSRHHNNRQFEAILQEKTLEILPVHPELAQIGTNP